ncbi:MAG TPA: hypothetical protein PLK35_03970 [Candidatus Moranbacteria bacterium]|nr:hypothetical protein [Candidatus Moranbacteria bacterium]
MENQPISVNLKSRETSPSFSPRIQREPVRPMSHDLRTVTGSENPSSGEDKKFIIKAFDFVISLSLFMLFFGFPLFFTGLTLQGIVFEKQLYFYLWLLLGLVAWTAKGVTIGEMNIRRTPLDIPIIGFWLVYLLATIFSVDRWHSFWGMFGDPSRGFMSITAMLIAYYLIFSNFNGKRLKLMFSALIASGAVVSLWTILAILNIKFLPDNLAQFAPISLSGSVVGISMIISSLIPLITLAILSLAGNETLSKIKKKTFLISLLALLALDLFLLLAIYNFVPWLGLFIGVVIFLVYILSQIVRPHASWTWLPMVIFVLVMVIKMIGAVDVAKINFAEIKPLDYKMSGEIAAESIKDKMILGSGPGTFGYDFSRYRPQSFNENIFYSLRFLQGTGIVLEAISTVGGLGTIMLLILVLSFVSVEIYLISREKEKNKLMSLGLFASTSILLVNVITTKAEGTVLILAALLGILSLATALWESDSRENNLSLSLKASPKFALALAFVFMMVSAGVAFLFVFLGKIYAADINAGSASRVVNQNREEAILKMSKAITFYEKEGRYYAQLGQYYMMLANEEALKGEQDRDVEKIKQYLNSSIAASNMGSNLMKEDVGTTEVLAQIYENAGLYVSDSLNMAVENYQRGLELEPHNPNYYLRIGQIKLSLAATKKDNTEKKKMLEEAKNMFQESVNKKTNLPEGYFYLSLVQEALGENDKAIESGKNAVALDQKNVDFIISLARMLQNRGKEEDMKNSELLYQAVINLDEKNINGHFYLGMFYEKSKKKQEAKEQYRKVIEMLPANSDEAKKQLEKMISNVDAGIENTPQSLGLIKEEQTSEPAEGQTSEPAAPAGEQGNGEVAPTE